MNLRFLALIVALAALLFAPSAHAQFELKGGATNLLDKRRAGGSPTVSISGVLTAITVRGGGSGYESAPAVSIAAPTSGTTATATAIITGGVVTAVNITNGGSGYNASFPPLINIAPPPRAPSGTPVTNVQFAGRATTAASSGAISTAAVTAGRYPRAITNTNGVSITTIHLKRSILGYAFASGVPRYFMGDEIQRPSVSWDGAPLADTNYWRAQPVQPGEEFNSVRLTNTVDGLAQPLLPAGTVAVTNSSTTSPVVEVSSVPTGLTVGATLLGREVQLINGNTLTLSGSANANIAADNYVAPNTHAAGYY